MNHPANTTVWRQQLQNSHFHLYSLSFHSHTLKTFNVYKSNTKYWVGVTYNVGSIQKISSHWQSILSVGHCCTYCHLIAQLKGMTQQKFLVHTYTVSNPAMFLMVKRYMLDIVYYTDSHIHTSSLRPLSHKIILQ
jgi:hypothetical protein